MAERKEEQGTGKQSNRGSEDSQSRTKESGTRGREERQETRSEEKDQDDGKQDDLKEREYRDEKGEIHHHTRTYLEQHEGEEEQSGSKKTDRGARRNVPHPEAAAVNAGAQARRPASKNKDHIGGH